METFRQSKLKRLERKGIDLYNNNKNEIESFVKAIMDERYFKNYK